jgi:hypothetical protein
VRSGDRVYLGDGVNRAQQIVDGAALILEKSAIVPVPRQCPAEGLSEMNLRAIP